MRAGNAGQPAVGAREVRAGLAELGWREDGGAPALYRTLAARLILTLALLEAEQGKAEYGLRLLDHAERDVAESDRGHLHSQRGVILLRMGRWAAALTELATAEPLAASDSELLATVLLNRSVLHLNTFNVQLARDDLKRCALVAAEGRQALLAAKATQNLGYCDLLGGDIPAALQRFDVAARAYQAIAPGILPGLEIDQARALLAAGLAGEAATSLDAAITALRRQHRDQMLAEAELSRARAAQTAGDLAEARHWASLAVRRFRARGNHAWAALAELTRVSASFDAATTSGSHRAYARIAAQAQQVAAQLRARGLPTDAVLADLTAARALAAAGRPADAARCLAAIRNRRGLPLDAMLLRRLARAELAAGAGRTNAALAELRSGLATVHARRGQFGSLDLQTGAAALGAELADLGLRLMLAGGSPRQVFSWTERSRAQSFRVLPVRPPADPHVAAVLTELRQLSFRIRDAELAGAPPDPAHLARRTELQRQLRERSWGIGGPGAVHATPDVAAVTAALAVSGQVLVSLAVHDKQLLAVTIAGNRFRLTHLGHLTPVAEAARRLTADLDVLAGRHLPARLSAVISESVRHRVTELDAALLAPLRPVIGSVSDLGVVLIPVGELAAIPWAMLPSLFGRPFTVCPSAAAWLSAVRASGKPSGPTPGQTPGQTGGSPLLVAGPGLGHAVSEVTGIAAIYPGSTPLTGADATVDATLRALDGTPLAHLATHGHHDQENVLFSRLDLADGPLMAYDVQGLSAPPRHVVLSACDAGRAVVRVGDELLGFTAALLHIGTPTVISSVTRVADEVAFGLMTAYHQVLSTGTRPATALALATTSVATSDAPVAPFVCFGAG
jgi:tetratricopeptide (TPR) repeat protein